MNPEETPFAQPGDVAEATGAAADEAAAAPSKAGKSRAKTKKPKFNADRFVGFFVSAALRAAPLLRVKVKITPYAIADDSLTYGELDCEFDFDSHEQHVMR